MRKCTMEMSGRSLIYLQRSCRSYEESKDLCQRINDLAKEYRNMTEQVETIEDLLDSQEWLIEACMEATKEYKRKAKSKVLNFKKDLEEAHIKVKTNRDLPDSRDATGSQVKEMIKHASELNSGVNDSYGSGQAIQSKEYTHSADDYEFNMSGEQDGMISLKLRLLNEDADKEIELEQNKDEGYIDDNSMLLPNDENNGIFRKRHSASRASEDEPIIGQEALNIL